MIAKTLSSLTQLNVRGIDAIVSNIVLDSRDVVAGSLYCAVKGAVNDGHDYIAEAIHAGASAIAVESADKFKAIPASYIVSENLKQELSALASIFYNDPSQSLYMVGVTGTNGKTSVVNFIAQLLNALGKPCASIGTLGLQSLSGIEDAVNTTPDAIRLQKYLYQIAQSGEQAVAMEVSSHALVQARCAAVKFDTAIFTNLSHDHLDYHGDMANYFAAKKMLFSFQGLKTAVINADDLKANELVASIAGSTKVITYAVSNSEADVYLRSKQLEANTLHLQLSYMTENYHLSSKLVGDFNIANLLAAVIAVVESGFTIADVVKAAEQLKAVDGRMQWIETAQPILAVVDYAHTPDALENALQALKNYQQAKLICVFGCGGDRDKAKRPLMAAIVEQYCDRIILTADNPRSESLDAINKDIITGFSTENFLRIDDRREAIEHAVAIAEAGDIILVAGKGHEKYQINALGKIAFDDVAVLQQALGGLQ